MTQKEKIELLKETIVFLYEKEGRSKNYISKLLNVDRRVLTSHIEEEWNLVKANIYYLKPSNQKFLNKHYLYIEKCLKEDYSVTYIAKKLKTTYEYLYKTIINGSPRLKEEFKFSKERLQKTKEDNKNNSERETLDKYSFEELPEEAWKEILGYPLYYASNKGRVKSYVSKYDCFRLLTPAPNKLTGRYYISIVNQEGQRKNLNLPRVIGLTWVEGHSEDDNTIDHIDGNFQNNEISNLEWVTQSKNNKRAYDNGKQVSKAYTKSGKFKKIIVNNQYEFKTIVACAKFIGKSETQTGRIIHGEVKNPEFDIKLIY